MFPWKRDTNGRKKQGCNRPSRGILPIFQILQMREMPPHSLMYKWEKCPRAPSFPHPPLFSFFFPPGSFARNFSPCLFTRRFPPSFPCFRSSWHSSLFILPYTCIYFPFPRRKAPHHNPASIFIVSLISASGGFLCAGVYPHTQSHTPWQNSFFLLLLYTWARKQMNFQK